MTVRFSRSFLTLVICSAPLLSSSLLSSSDAAADPLPPPPPPTRPATDAPPASTAPAPSGDAPPSASGSGPTTATVESKASPQRAESVVPHPAEAPPRGKIEFAADPIADGGIILGVAGFAGLLDLINSTGEIRPQQISSNFDTSKLLGIDRGAVSQQVDSNARTYSSVGLFLVAGFALVDPIASGLREESVQAGLVDGIMYAESAALTWGVTNLAKMAVRRPRPQAYIDAAAHKNDPTYSNADTDSSLSFFSGHASITATISATATYLAFARSPGTARPWITMGVGAALTTFVSVERVRGGAHFPTDVIAGAIAGAGIGVIVPHLHRSEELKQRRVWVGYTPESNAGGTVQVGGVW